MYGLWILTIILGVLFFGGLTAIIVYEKCGKSSLSYSDWLILIVLVMSVLGFAFIALLGCSIGCPIGAKREVAQYALEKEWIEQTIMSGTDYENIMVTERIIDYNHWLADAQASYMVHGNWSRYCYTNVMELKPISLPR